MKIKALLATLIGAVALQGVSAGEWCPPAPDKCPVECCDDTNGEVSFGYGSDYIFYGVRLARDHVWADANYTFDGLPLPLTVGVWHLSSLGSGGAVSDAYGDETNLYASVALPSFCGFDASLGYKALFYPTTRQPSPGTAGDSQNELSLSISREIFCGVTLGYTAAYDFNVTDFNDTVLADRSGAWVHTLGLSKSVDITDCLALDLAGGVLYTDNYWENVAGATKDSGWNNYYLSASLPIALSGCATLTPYVGYSGTPDTWVADGINGGVPGANQNDVFHGGVSISVGF
ncbi:MAG: hypothetical protein P1U89_09750 [Verrucomicrobiales bacterium]|nr:hypothetical protein [Verrucomicrobiales bacterium]